MKYAYTVWLQQPALPESDPDFEWPACFLIEGADETSAKDQGDRLSHRYARTNNLVMLRSNVEAVETSTLPGLDALPIVQEGEDATDEKSGW